MLDLNDLRCVAAVHELGSLSAAARSLGTSHATVFRCVNELEAELGVRLFERSKGRYVATPAGEELAAAGAAISQTAAKSLLKVVGQDLRPSGTVRITTTESLAQTVLNPALKRCRAQFPQISLQVLIDDQLLDLSKRDADIALRPTAKPPDYLIGKRIAALAFAVYGEKAYLHAHRELALAQHQWIALGEAQERHRTVKWLAALLQAEHLSLDHLSLRCDGFSAVARACADGLGLAVLPCFLGDSLPELQRLPTPDRAPNPAPGAAWASELWLLTHPDLRHTARVKAVFQILQAELALQVPLLEGNADSQRASAHAADPV